MNKMALLSFVKPIFKVKLLVFILWAVKVNAEQSLTVLIPDFPPYTFQENNQVSGIGPRLVEDIFSQANIKVNYRVLPNYAKVLHELKKNRGDAFLLASQNKERDGIAEFSAPLMTNRWAWFVRKDAKVLPSDKGFKSQAVISSHFNSNTHIWLKEQGYNVKPAMKVTSLPDLLTQSRVDAVFVAELVFEHALTNSNADMSQFTKFVEREVPFGIYVSKQYLAEFPDTLAQINRAIHSQEK